MGTTRDGKIMNGAQKMQTQGLPKIACVGAGNVGATAAQYCLEMELGNVVLMDIVEGLPQGKALDMTEAGPIRNYGVTCIGTNDYADIAGADLVIVTAGLARKPGMTRLDLLEKNGRIIAGICEKIKHHAPEANVIDVTNPLDVMVHPPARRWDFQAIVLGMAGCLTAPGCVPCGHGTECKYEECGHHGAGSHGDCMVPLPQYTTVSGIPITQLMPPTA